MKILQLIQKKQLRGAELFACLLSNHLQQKGHTTKVLALTDGSVSLPSKETVEVLYADLNHRFWDVKGWKALAKFIHTFEPDLIQVNAGDTLKYAVLSKLMYHWKQPVVFRNASMMSSYVKNPFTKWLNRFLLGKTNHIASVSLFTKNDLEKNFGIKASCISVLPVGVEEFYPHTVKEKNNELKLLHIGGFSFEKNHEGLLRIFEAILKQVPQAHLTLVGDGALRNHIEKMVHTKGLSDRVCFTGNVLHVEAYLQKADVFILPSIIEGLPSVILEAFNCSVPVIAYNTGGISELVNEETGWLVPLHHEADFAERILEVAALNKSILAAKTAAANYSVQIKYRNSAIADQFLKMYSSVVNPSNK